MISQIASTQMFGMPLVVYGGIITLLSFLFTASISVMNKRGITVIPFKWHPVMAAISIILALIHGLMGISMFFPL